MAVGGPVERATRAELRQLHVSVQQRSNAALAVSLARQIDSARGAVAAAASAKVLTEIMDRLKAEADELRPEKDELDELRERRSDRDRRPAASS